MGYLDSLAGGLRAAAGIVSPDAQKQIVEEDQRNTMLRAQQQQFILQSLQRQAESGAIGPEQIAAASERFGIPAQVIGGPSLEAQQRSVAVARQARKDQILATPQMQELAARGDYDAIMRVLVAQGLESPVEYAKWREQANRPVGNFRKDENGNWIRDDAPKAPTPKPAGTTRDIQKGTEKVTEELQPDGTWKEIGRGPAFARQVPPVVVTGGGGGQGKPPAGYRFKPDGSLEAIPGGPADAKKQGAFNADTASLQSTESALNRLEVSANELLRAPGLAGITGIRGKIPNIPGSDAANAEANLQKLKSQVAFGVLQAMRDASKTGGALGAVSEKELALLENNLAALDKAQSYEGFQKSLGDIIKYVNESKERLRRAYNLKHGDGAQSGSGASGGWSIQEVK